MVDKFRNKYRIASARLQTWDYSRHAAYFITICTAGGKDFFGHIHNNVLYLSDIGKIVQSEWYKTPQIRPDMNLKLGASVVMPNHVHGIIIIGGRDAMHRVSTSPSPSSSSSPSQSPKNKFGPQRKNLASIIRGIKSSVTKQARSIDPAFGWQARFYDIIIRTEKSYDNIENYINTNIENWNKDRFYT